MALKPLDIIYGGVLLGLGLVVWQNKDTLVSMLQGKEKGDAVAPENIPSQAEIVNRRDIYGQTVRSWTSSKWNNGKKRIVDGGHRDPSDAKFFFAKVGNTAGTIDGKGILTIAGGSPRLSVWGSPKWVNTEITFFTKGNIGDWLAIHGGSDHHNEKGTKKGTWGGYALKIYKTGNNSGVQKEPQHGTYCRARASSKVKYTIGSGWVGWKGIQLTQGNTTVLEAYINESGDGNTWKKLFREEDNGSFSCDKKARTTGGPHIWIRFNGDPRLQVKDLSVREILK